MRKNILATILTIGMLASLPSWSQMWWTSQPRVTRIGIGVAVDPTCQLVLGADDQAYMTILQTDAGGVTFNSVSDGTASFNFSDPVRLGIDQTAGTPNVAGRYRLWSAGDNAFYADVVAATMTASGEWTWLPALPAGNYLVNCSSAGAFGYTDPSTFAAVAHNHAGVYEPVLGNPATTGWFLSSTDAGVRSWAAALTAEVDGDVTNEVNTITGDDTNTTSGLAITVVGGGINATSVAGNTVTVTGTEAQDLDAVLTIGGTSDEGVGLTWTSASKAVALTDNTDINGATVTKYLLAITSAMTDTTANNLNGALLRLVHNNTMDAGGYDYQFGLELIEGTAPTWVYAGPGDACIETDIELKGVLYLTDGTGTVQFSDAGNDHTVTFGPLTDDTTILPITGTLNATGLQVGGVAVALSTDVHTQNTDTGTTSATFTVSSASADKTQLTATGIARTGTTTNLPLILTWKGSSALQVTATGNARGNNAIDLQKNQQNNAQVASGTNSVISGGFWNTASGSYSTVGGGHSNSAGDMYDTVCGGVGNAVNSYGPASIPCTIVGGSNNTCATDTTGAFVGAGERNTAGAHYSHVSGGLYGKTTLYGMMAHAAGRFAATGDAQFGRLILRNSTASTDPTELFLDGSTRRAVLTAERTWLATIRIVARQDDGSSGKAERSVLIQRTSTTTALCNSVETVNVDYWHASLGTPTVAVTADDTNEALVITVTAANATATRWLATVELTEIGY